MEETKTLDKKKESKKFKIFIISIILFAIGSSAVYVWIYSDYGVDYGNFKISPIDPKDAGNNLTGEITYTLDAQSDSNWAYFDFSQESVVTVTDPKSMDWDIGFRRLKIITNGGEPNPEAKGGVMNLVKKDFNQVDSVPSGNFITDKSYDIEDGKILPLNDIFKKWYIYTHLSHKLWPKDEVYIFRTADGKYAKVKLLSYYCEGKTAGCYTFKYIYQGDGSTSFVKK